MLLSKVCLHVGECLSFVEMHIHAVSHYSSANKRPRSVMQQEVEEKSGV